MLVLLLGFLKNCNHLDEGTSEICAARLGVLPDQMDGAVDVVEKPISEGGHVPTVSAEVKLSGERSMQVPFNVKLTALYLDEHGYFRLGR